MAAGPELRAMLDRLEADCAVPLTQTERLLLSTDGTVTHAIAALVDTHIDVKIIGRKTYDDTLHRSVALTRGDTGDQMVYAQSQVDLTCVDDPVAEELTRGESGIGDLLRHRGAETYRQIKTMERRSVRDAKLPAFVGTFPTTYLEREYTIHSDGDELMGITEWFPRCKY